MRKNDIWGKVALPKHGAVVAQCWMLMIVLTACVSTPQPKENNDPVEPTAGLVTSTTPEQGAGNVFIDSS